MKVILLPFIIVIFIAAAIAAPFVLMVIYPLNWTYNVAMFVYDAIGRWIITIFQPKPTSTFTTPKWFKPRASPEGYQVLNTKSSTIVDLRKAVLSADSVDLSKQVHSDERDSDEGL